MSVLHQNSGVIGKSIPSALEISLDPQDFPENLPENLLAVGDGFPNTSLLLVDPDFIFAVFEKYLQKPLLCSCQYTTPPQQDLWEGVID